MSYFSAGTRIVNSEGVHTILTFPPPPQPLPSQKLQNFVPVIYAVKTLLHEQIKTK